ncbi:MAG TPA: ShlB/FhaC/HecB family hemolysin secretion/activation protein [Burkholderiales bacterium]|nr:ShlB/FhaC/HecB family hemolysin secretion/activation protein [Burkholderiales bacterium]
MQQSRTRRLLAAVVFAALSHLAFAQTPLIGIERFVVEGNTLLTQQEIDRTLAPFSGKDKDFGDIQRALEALEERYRAAGWGVVQVSLPEQDITKGVVQFRVTEARLGKVVIEGNTHFSDANVRRSVPSLVEGTTPNSRETGRNLQVAAENPAKQTTVLLRAGEQEREVDAVIKVADERPWKASASVDNTGTAQTGKHRLNLGYLHANLFDRDHTLTAQYITSPGRWSDAKVYGVGYRIPFYALGSSFDIVAGYSDVDTGTVGNLFTVSGAGTIGALRWNQHLQRLTDYEHKIVYGLDYRAYQNRVIAQDQSIVPDITVHPVSVYYSGIYRTSTSELNFYVFVAQNVFPHGNDATDEVFKTTRTDAKAAYRVYRYQAAYVRLLPRDWQVRGVVNGQYSNDALVPGEQFGVGGSESVRGFNEREVVNDRGYRVSLEVHSPDVGSALKWEDARLRALAFFDAGAVRRNKPVPDELTSEFISSAGVGLRYSWGKTASARVDYAYVLNSGGSQAKGDSRVHFSLALVY